MVVVGGVGVLTDYKQEFKGRGGFDTFSSGLVRPFWWLGSTGSVI